MKRTATVIAIIVIILIIIYILYNKLVPAKRDQIKCGPKPGAPGNWICKGNGWVLADDLPEDVIECGPEPRHGPMVTLECVGGTWISSPVKMV